MNRKPTIFVINGSASHDSANQKLIAHIWELAKDDFDLKVFNGLKALPHFDPELSTDDPPKTIAMFRKEIEETDGILICTPEYVFSIPSGLKNAIEWCVATTIFSDKPTGLITASASGEKGHEELKLIMRTIMAKFTAETTLLIQGVKGKLNETGITDKRTEEDLKKFIEAFNKLVNE